MVALVAAAPHRQGACPFVMNSTDPVPVPATAGADARLVWIGEDDRGLELEVVALDLPQAVVVIHVMPTGLRR